MTTPANGIKIPIGGASGPFSFNNARQIFGGVNFTVFSRTNLSQYVRGGYNVPDIPENAHVPTAPPITLNQLRNSYTSIYYSGPMATETVNINLSNPDGQDSQSLNVDGGENLGYGFIRESCEYRYTLTRSNGSYTPSYIYAQSGNPSVYSAANRNIIIYFNVPETGRNFYDNLLLTVYARYLYGSRPELSNTKTIRVNATY